MKYLRLLLGSMLSFFATITHCETKIENNTNSVIVIGDQNSLSDVLKAVRKDGVDGKSTAIIQRNVISEKDAIFLGDVNSEGFQIINNIKSTDEYHYYKFKTSSVGDIEIDVLKRANNFYVGIMELGGEAITYDSKHLTQFFPPGEYLLYVKRDSRPTPYMISIKLKPY